MKQILFFLMMSGFCNIIFAMQQEQPSQELTDIDKKLTATFDQLRINGDHKFQ